MYHPINGTSEVLVVLPEPASNRPSRMYSTFVGLNYWNRLN